MVGSGFRFTFVRQVPIPNPVPPVTIEQWVMCKWSRWMIVLGCKKFHRYSDLFND